MAAENVGDDVVSDTLPDFSGKLVLFYVRNSPGGMANGVVIEHGTFSRFGGRLFVVGRTPEKTDSMWAARLEGGIAWDAVLHYLVFVSREDYERRMANAAPGLAKRFAG